MDHPEEGNWIRPVPYATVTLSDRGNKIIKDTIFLLSITLHEISVIVFGYLSNSS